MIVSLADYGVGNLHSIKKALENCGANVTVVTEMKELTEAECIVFPGVGAFDKTMERLSDHRDDILDSLKNGTPALGICIGTHIQLDDSEEGSSKGIGLIPGNVKKLKAKQIPHIGWNSVASDDEMFGGIQSMQFYFAHSYRCSPLDDDVIRGTTVYDDEVIPSFLRKGNFCGCQFHPEKSSSSGIRFLQNFIEFAEGCL